MRDLENLANSDQRLAAVDIEASDPDPIDHSCPVLATPSAFAAGMIATALATGAGDDLRHG